MLYHHLDSWMITNGVGRAQRTGEGRPPGDLRGHTPGWRGKRRYNYNMLPPRCVPNCSQFIKSVLAQSPLSKKAMGWLTGGTQAWESLDCLQMRAQSLTSPRMADSRLLLLLPVLPQTPNVVPCKAKEDRVALGQHKPYYSPRVDLLLNTIGQTENK